MKLHFDRIPTPKVPAKSDQTQVDRHRPKVVGQGAWKSGGRRGNQEDTFGKFSSCCHTRMRSCSILDCARSIMTTSIILSPTTVLHEIKNEKKGENVLLAGVFDGHAGTAASETVSCLLPSLFTTELLATHEAMITNALEKSWETTCDLYRNGCDENGECSARYDAVEGILYAETGSKDLFGKSSQPLRPAS